MVEPVHRLRPIDVDEIGLVLHVPQIEINAAHLRVAVAIEPKRHRHELLALGIPNG